LRRSPRLTTTAAIGPETDSVTFVANHSTRTRMTANARVKAAARAGVARSRRSRIAGTESNRSPPTLIQFVTMTNGTQAAA